MRLLFLPLLAACGGSGGSSGPPFGLTQRQVITTVNFPTGLPQPDALDAVPAFPGVTFQSPVGITHRGSGTC